MDKKADPIAAPVAPAPAAPFYNQPDNVLRALAGRRMLMLGLGAMGIGAAVRGAHGLADLATGTLGAPPETPLRRRTVDVPVMRLKAAEGPVPAVPAAAPATAAAPTPDGLTTAIGHAMNWARQMRRPGEQFGSLGNLFHNPMATKIDQIPWAKYLGPGLAVGGGLAGGYHLADWALGKSKAHETKTELDAARRDYEDALGKTAAADDPCPTIELLYQSWRSKQAESGQPIIGPEMANAASPLTAGWLTAAGLAALFGGVGGYKYTRSTARDTALSSALKDRRERLFTATPPPIFVSPVPGGAPDADRRAKAASLAASADAALAMLHRKRQAQQEQLQRHIATMANGGVPPDEGKAEKPQPPQPPQLPSVVRPAAPQQPSA